MMGEVSVGRQKGLFVAGGGGHHKVSDSLQPEKKRVPESSALDLEMECTWNGFIF